MSPRTRIREEQTEDISFVSESEINEFFGSVIITGTETETAVIDSFSAYFPGQGLVIGTDGITVVTGSNYVTASGFYGEFSSTATNLQDQIFSNDTEIAQIRAQTFVSSITASGVTVTGSVVFAGIDGVSFQAAAGPVTSQVTASGFRNEFVSASGSLSQTISSELVTISGYLQPQINLNKQTSAGGYIAVSEAISTTTSDVFQQKLRLNADLRPVVTGTTDQFRLLWYYEWGHENASTEFVSQVQVDDIDTLGTISWRPAATNVNDYAPSSGFIDMTLTSGTHFFDLDYRSGQSGKTARIQRARLSLSRVSLFPGVQAPPQRGS